MVDNPSKYLKGLVDAQFSRAKRFWTYVNVCRLIILVINIASIFSGVATTNLFAAISAVTGILAVVFQFHSDRHKGLAESLLRQYEAYDGLGWPVSRKTVSDVLAELPRKLREHAMEPSILVPYYSSHAPVSPKRTLENLEESSWWTKHLSRNMANLVLLLILAMLITSIAALVVTLNTVESRSVVNDLSRASVSAVAFLFTGGLVRLWLDYQRLGQGAARTEDMACQELANHAELEVVQVFNVMHEYHIVRASGPLIPDWIFYRSKPALDTMWKALRTR